MTRTLWAIEYDGDWECQFKPWEYHTSWKGITVKYRTKEAMDEVRAMTSEQLENAYWSTIRNFKN